MRGLSKKQNAASRSYERPRGFSSGGAINPTVYPRIIKNMYIDYEGGGDALESVPGFRRIYSFSGAIHSIVPILLSGTDECIYVHAGDGLYRFLKSERDSLTSLTKVARLQDAKSYCLSCGSMAFITDGTKLIKVNAGGESEIISEDQRIAGCRALTLFDGRLFLSGNPDCGGLIFYSSRIGDGNICFSDDGIINDSHSKALITSLLSLGDSLWVFKSSDAGEGGIICHTIAKNADGAEEYPVSRIYSGVYASGEAMALYDQILFISPDGLSAIERPRSDDSMIVSRSKGISSHLLAEDLSSATLGLWQGYVTLSVDGRIYLANTRAGLQNSDLEWYLIDGVGSYKNDHRVYRYSSEARSGYNLNPDKDAVAEGEIISLTDASGETVYYEELDGKKYLVYPTEEYRGGDFHPACALLTQSGLMWFGTNTGDLFLFNNDKRSLPPDHLKNQDGFNIEEYKRLYQGKIHPDFYSFYSHAPEYLVEYYSDGCESEDRSKNTVAGSLSVCCKTFTRSNLTITVLADGKEVCNRKITPTAFGFYELDFGYLPASSSDEICIQVPERAVGWRKKQLILSGKTFSSPFGIKSIGYRYTLRKGRNQGE